MAYDLGDVVGLAITVKDSTGVAANASSVVCTITLPDGTTATPTVANPSTGSYTVDYSATQIGRYLVRWVATGTNASSYTDSFQVNDPADLPLVSLADLKTYLNITSTTNDEELRQFILEATDIAERLTGRRLARQAVTETFTARGTSILLNVPVVSITSVVEDGTTLAATDYQLHGGSGIITRVVNGIPSNWSMTATQNITITYVAGEASPNPTAGLLVKELARHLWRTQRGSSPMAMGGQDDFIPGGNNIITYRVKELSDLLRVPGIA